MNSISLGRLERVDVRDIWQTEAQDFTPWLARPENMSVLADVLDMDLEIEAQEKNVGPFRADILCKDTTDESWVLIENQLERTDHTHLGQLMTYAAGLQAVTIVWVSTRFTDEHRAALDWLNEITDDKFRFYGLEVELWRIGDSPAAPKFNVISQPNQWSRSVGTAARRLETGDLSDTRTLQLKFWTQLVEVLKNHPAIRVSKPRPQHWYQISIGRAGFFVSATLDKRRSRFGVELYLGGDDAKAHFHLLLRDRMGIENELGVTLDWQELPNRTASRIITFKESCDPSDEERWPEYQRWVVDTLERFESVFRGRVRSLDASEYEPEPPHTE